MSALRVVFVWYMVSGGWCTCTWRPVARGGGGGALPPRARARLRCSAHSSSISPGFVDQPILPPRGQAHRLLTRAPPISPKSSARSAYFSSLRPIGAAQVQVSAVEQDCLNYSRIKFHNLPLERAEVWARCKDWNAKLTMWLEEPSEGANSTKGKFSQLCFHFLTS